MPYDLADFCADARAALSQDAGTAGRRKLIGYLENLLANRDFVAAHLGPDAPSGVERLYEDPDHGFVVLAHVNREPSKNSPHDHGKSWAVYGMAVNYTDMTEYRRADGGADMETDEVVVEKTKAYRLEQGTATLFDTGVIHALDRDLETRLVRVTGADLDTITRYRYNLETNKVTQMPPTAEVSRQNMNAA